MRVGVRCRFRFFPRPLRSLYFFAALVCRLHFLFFFRKLWGFERLPVKSDLGDADRGIVLPVSTQLLVLLFTLVVEDEDFVAASVLDDLAGDQRSRTGGYNAAGLGRNRENVCELDLTVLIGLR